MERAEMAGVSLRQHYKTLLIGRKGRGLLFQENERLTAREGSRAAII